MLDQLPIEVIEAVQRHYAHGVKRAEECFDMHYSDEDSITGGLGQSLATAAPIKFSAAGTKYSITVSYQKVRGRGPNAPEKKFGTDGFFEIIMSDEHNKSIFIKTLPFQSKVEWVGSDRSLYNQAKTMRDTLGSGIVIDYSKNGYKGAGLDSVISAGGDRKQVGKMYDLSDLLGNQFLRCLIGKKGLKYDRITEKLGPFGQDQHVISTSIILS